MDEQVNYSYNKGDDACMRVTIKEDYHIIKSDQRSFQYVYEEYSYLNKMTHPDDWSYVKEFLESSQEDEFVVARLLRSDKVYRKCCLSVVKRNIKIKNDTLMELEIRDMVNVLHRFDIIDINVRKYRTYLAMIPEKFFEYDIKSGVFSAYKYRGSHSDIIAKGPIDEIVDRAVKKAEELGENKELINSYFDILKKCTDSFTFEIETALMSGGNMKELLSLHGQSMKYNNETIKIVGLISSVSRMGDETARGSDNDMATKDSATGLLNKKAMTDYVASRIRYFEETGKKEKFWLIICDIDYFKHVNDTYGHLFGDEVIYRFAQTLKTWFGQRGIVGRIGGDEFMVMTEGINDITELRCILTGMRKELEWAFQDKVQDYRFTTSIGVAQYPGDACDYERLFRTADKALYIAKDKGRNRFIIYTKELHGELEEDAVGSYLSKTEMKPMAKNDMIASLAYLLVTQGSSMIPSVLSELVDHLNIHGITVYVADENKMLQAKWSGGRYEVSSDDFGLCVNEDYYKLYDSNGIFVVNNVREYENSYDPLFEYWKSHGICSSLHYLIGSKDDVKAIVAFDIFGEHRRKWSESDIETLYLLMKFMGNVLE